MGKLGCGSPAKFPCRHQWAEIVVIKNGNSHGCAELHLSVSKCYSAPWLYWHHAFQIRNSLAVKSKFTKEPGLCGWWAGGVTPLRRNRCVILLYKQITRVFVVLGILNWTVRLHLSVRRVLSFKLLLKAGFVQAHSSNPVTHKWDEQMSWAFQGILWICSQGKSIVRKGEQWINSSYFPPLVLWWA